MRSRIFVAGLAVAGGSLLFAACSGVADVTPAPQVSEPSATPAPTAAPTPVETAAAPSEVPTSTPAPQPTATPRPAATLPPVTTPAPEPTAVPQPPAPTPTPQPTPPPQPTSTSGPTPLPAGHDAPTTTSGGESNVRWSFNGFKWSPNGEPPACPSPLGLQTPVDMSLVTAALWPGQSRGGYKGHGGFRFDSSSGGEITVRAPISGHLVQAARYLEGSEEQVLLFFSVPCGFFYRFDHVGGLSPKIEEALEVITGPPTEDSRTTFMRPPLWVEQGEIVGTSVGIPPSNIFVDFGLYDVRQPNNVVPNPEWADSFANDKEFGHYGVCFFDYLPGDDGDIMRSLPTGKEGKTSDYCD